MTNDADWVEDVRRWCLSGARSVAAHRSDLLEPTDLIALGYEAAHPALQAQHWPDAPLSTISDLR